MIDFNSNYVKKDLSKCRDLKYDDLYGETDLSYNNLITNKKFVNFIVSNYFKYNKCDNNFINLKFKNGIFDFEDPDEIDINIIKYRYIYIIERSAFNILKAIYYKSI